MPPDATDRAWRLAAAAAVAVPVLLIIAALMPMARALAALVLVVLPGYLIAWPILRPRLGIAGAFTVSGAVAIGMVVIGGLALNLLPWGLQAGTWILYVVVMLSVAILLDRPRILWRPRVEVGPHELILGSIGATLLVVSLLFARLFVASPAESFTQLWVAPSAGAPGSAVVSIRSEEQTPTAYRLQVQRNGTLLKSWALIQLTTGQTWSDIVTAGAGPIEVQLSRLSDPSTVYRRVTLLLTAAGA